MITPTDIIGVELVNPYECTGSREPEDPGHERTQDRELAFMQVVGEDGVELFHSKHNRFNQLLSRLIEIRPNVGNDVRSCHSPRYANGRPS